LNIDGRVQFWPKVTSHLACDIRLGRVQHSRRVVSSSFPKVGKWTCICYVIIVRITRACRARYGNLLLTTCVSRIWPKSLSPSSTQCLENNHIAAKWYDLNESGCLASTCKMWGHLRFALDDTG
jgi:hypothetical protein